MVRLSPLLLLAIALLACGGAVPSPTASPPATPAATALPSFGPDEIAHPTGSADVVLRMDTVGGFLMPDFLASQAPGFTLYGDGTIVVRSSRVDERSGGGFVLPSLLTHHLDEATVQALLRFALGQGRLAAAREAYQPNNCADYPTTVFTVNAANLVKRVSVDCLGAGGPEGPDAADMRGFAALVDTLSTFDRRPDFAGASLYDPPLYRVVLMETPPGVDGDIIEWPWEDLATHDFDSVGEGWQRAAVLTREQVARLTDIPSPGASSILVEDAAGDLWTASVRPLLPEEIAAGGLPDGTAS